jgi:DNA modification methylase
VLKNLPDERAHCVVTSPPYFGLRDYGHAGQIGLEPTPDVYVAAMVGVFQEVRRVLRKDGTVWLNLGDSYARTTPNAGKGGSKERPGLAPVEGYAKTRLQPGAKDKDLLGIPWRVAFALQADGWYLRQDIIWAKPNPMPESVTDRCTKAHEYIFLLSRSERYFYDAAAIAEPASYPEGPGNIKPVKGASMPGFEIRGGFGKGPMPSDTRNKRSVWTVASQPFSDAHFATFPPALIEPCIKAGTSERGCCAKCGAPWVREVEKYEPAGRRDDDRGDQFVDFGMSSGRAGSRPATTIGWSPSCACDAAVAPCTVLDPFGGAGTTGLVADRLGRNAILIELNPTYAAMSDCRIRDDAGLFAVMEA